MRRFLLLFLLLCGVVPATSLAQLRDVEGTPATPFYSVAARGDTLLAGATNVLYISTDRGDTWHPSTPIEDEVPSVDAVIATDAGWFVGCFTRGVFRSVDQGMTWTPLNQGLSGIGALYVSDFEQWGNHLYAATEGAGVFELDLENPTPWHRFGNEFAENVSETVTELALHEGSLVAAAGGNGFVFVRNLQEGDHWTPVQLGGQHLSVAYTGLGLISTTRRAAYVSVDQGATWQPTGPFSSGLYATIATSGNDVPASTAYLAVSIDAGVGFLYRSSDLTQAWEHFATTPETNEMLAYDNRLYLAQSNGLRTWTLDPGTGNEHERPTIPELQLTSIAPHPVDDRAFLTYETDQAGWVWMEIFDVLGRRVLALDNYAAAGQQVMVLETVTLAAGLYLARLRNETQISSRSMVVVR